MVWLGGDCPIQRLLQGQNDVHESWQFKFLRRLLLANDCKLILFSKTLSSAYKTCTCKTTSATCPLLSIIVTMMQTFSFEG
jgi:hypothetical protein